MVEHVTTDFLSPNMYAIHDASQSDTSLNENCTGNSFDNVATVEPGPTGVDDENESLKA